MQTRAEAEKTARDLLDVTWAPCPDDGGRRLPVDPVYIAGRLGIRVVPVRLEREVTGMLAKRAGQDAEIYVNALDSANRQRFWCAHEIGHYVERVSGDPDDSWGYIDCRGIQAAPEHLPGELFADRFAEELLMPEQEVRHLARERSAAGLAVMFGVSLGAMKARLGHLGLA